MQITIFSKNNCRKCKMTKALFNRGDQNPTITEINIDEPEFAHHKEELKEEGFKVMPVVKVFDDNGELVDSWSDFQDKKVKEYA